MTTVSVATDQKVNVEIWQEDAEASEEIADVLLKVVTIENTAQDFTCEEGCYLVVKEAEND